MKKKILVLTFLLIFAGNVFSQQCEYPTCSGPGGDNADDNYSYANLCNTNFCVFTSKPEVIVYKWGFYNESINLFDKQKFGINTFSLNENQ